ncbi:MAG: YbjN domain-containing protein [Oscillospiraceae bacterium]|jgi:hypothetical protein|nr:YbjN domain-containing protein [Oscillospiraceae bacterium]MBQ9908095.1 YbjN domain-containing protein [Oscillospiraceae bacterium]MBR5364463.1 YbjN domain-containing protein [Oscillospiraceae bacterium]
MYPAIEEIVEVFNEKDVHFSVQENDDNNRVIASVVVDYTSFTVYFISSDETNDISVRVPHFVRFKEKERRDMLRIANRMNDKYRFCKFTVNDESEAVTIEYDFAEKTENIGEAVEELFRRLMQIAEEAYPEFMRAIWGKPETAAEPQNLGNIVFHDFEV